MEEMIAQWGQHECTRRLSKALDDMLNQLLMDVRVPVLSEHKGPSEYVLGQLNVLNSIRHLGRFLSQVVREEKADRESKNVNARQ